MSSFLPKSEWIKYKEESRQEVEKAKKDLTDGILSCEESLILRSEFENFSKIANRYRDLEKDVERLIRANHNLFQSGRYTSEQIKSIDDERLRKIDEKEPLWSEIVVTSDRLQKELDCPVWPMKIIDYERSLKKHRESGDKWLEPEWMAMNETFRSDFDKVARDAERRVKEKYYGSR